MECGIKMIIKMTFFDNDYSELLEQIAESFCNNRFCIMNKIEDETLTQDIKIRDAWNTLMDPRTNDIGDDPTYLYCLRIIRKYVEEFIREDDEYAAEIEHLMSSLHIAINTEYISTRENGESLYIFLRGDNTWLVQ